MVVIPSASSTPSARRDAGEKIHALIIDRQPLFTAAIGSLLEAPQIDAEVVTTVRSDVGLDIVRQDSIDLVLCEVRAEPMSGVDLVAALAAEGRGVPVILLGDEGDEQQLATALGTTAAGLFTKNAGLDEFLDGVQAVLSGHRAVGSVLLTRLLDRINQPPPHDPKGLSNQLSPTELEILAMIGQAQSIPAIAASRGISHKTVRNHLAKIYRKLELHGRTEAMLWAARMGLTST